MKKNLDENIILLITKTQKKIVINTRWTQKEEKQKMLSSKGSFV